MNKFVIVFMASLMGLIGCQSAQSNPSKPAIINQTTPEMKAEILTAIVALKGGVAPRISDTVFMKSNKLFLSSGIVQQKLGHTNSGLEFKPSHGFILQKRGTNCVLYYPPSDKYITLNTVKCIAID